MTIQDWGVTYEELEPHYDRFEYLCGTSGAAGNLRAQILDGGNPFEGPRSRPYPMPPQEQPFGHTLFARAHGARLQAVPATLGEHVAALPQSPRRAPGTVHLLRILRVVRLRKLFQGEPADDDPAGADPQAEFRAAHRERGAAINLTPDGKRATGVTFVDAQGKEWSSRRTW